MLGRRHLGGDVVEIHHSVPVESRSGLHLQNPPHRLVDAGPGQASIGYRFLDGFEGHPDVGWGEDDVHTRLDGEDRGFTNTIAVGNRTHAESVRKDESSKPHLFTEQLREEKR